MHYSSYSPSMLGRQIFQELFPDCGLLRLAECGLHAHNPYHNLTHELSVVYYAYTAYVNEPHANETQIRGASDVYDLLIAALFHDHNHSGGKELDPENIQRAIAFVNGPEFNKNAPYTTGLGWDNGRKIRITDIIRVTMFRDGEFPMSPATLAQSCIRDADLMSIYTHEGRALLVGLFRELGKDIINCSEAQQKVMLENNYEFLNKAKMFTQYGKLMQKYHLDQACEDFQRELQDGLFFE